MTIKLNKNQILVLRTSDAEGRGYGGFQYPKSGLVEAPDWDGGKPVCGGGLHGLPAGEGDISYMRNRETAQVLLVDRREGYIEFWNKCKFRRGKVVFFGELVDAATFVAAHYPEKVVHFAVRTVGNKETAMVGEFGTAISGDHGNSVTGNRGTAKTGDHGNASVGYKGTATAGKYGNASAGHKGTAITGDHGTAIARNCGTAITGDHGTATAEDEGIVSAGDYGTAIAGDHGTATAGRCGTAIAGYAGTVGSGNGGIIQVKSLDVLGCRVHIGYVGKNGIKPNRLYKWDNGFVEVKK